AGGFTSLFPSIQLGIGSAGGPEVALQKIQTYLDTHPSHSLLSIDVKNAFNTVSRRLTATELYSLPKAAPLYRLFNFLYSTPSALYVYGHPQSDAISPDSTMPMVASDLSDPSLHTLETSKPT